MWAGEHSLGSNPSSAASSHVASCRLSDLSVPQLPRLRTGDSDGLPHRAAMKTK